MINTLRDFIDKVDRMQTQISNMGRKMEILRRNQKKYEK